MLTLSGALLYTHIQRREKTSECPFNLNQALWGFSRESACGMRRLFVSQRLFPVQSRTQKCSQKTQICGIPYLLPLIFDGRTEFWSYRARADLTYPSLWMLLLGQMNPGLAVTVRGSRCSGSPERDQVDQLPLFRSMAVFTHPGR